MRTILATVVACTILALPAAAQELAGSGTWQSVKAQAVRGTWRVTLTQSGETVRGTLTLAGSNVFSGGAVEGTLQDGRLVLGVLQQGARLATFSGTHDGTALATDLGDVAAIHRVDPRRLRGDQSSTSRWPTLPAAPARRVASRVAERPVVPAPGDTPGNRSDAQPAPLLPLPISCLPATAADDEDRTMQMKDGS